MGQSNFLATLSSKIYFNISQNPEFKASFRRSGRCPRPHQRPRYSSDATGQSLATRAMRRAY